MNIIWHNGEIVKTAISIAASDRGLTLGDGIFETIAVHANRPIWLNEHLTRMKGSAHELKITFDEETVRAGIAEVLDENMEPTAALRLTLTRGVVTPRALTGEGTNPNLLITLSAYDVTKPQSITLATSTIRRNETAPSCRLKTLSYIDNIMAAREVASKADDALMLNTKGNVACTTIGNLFLVKADKLTTPAADQGILKGITRAKLLSLAEEAIVTINDLYEADAIFRTNSLRFITPVTMLDGKPLKTASLLKFEQLLKEGIEP